MQDLQMRRLNVRGQQFTEFMPRTRRAREWSITMAPSEHGGPLAFPGDDVRKVMGCLMMDGFTATIQEGGG